MDERIAVDMTKKNPSPTDWHFRPKGSSGPCPICGCWMRSRRHRAIDASDPRWKAGIRWLVRYEATVERGEHIKGVAETPPPRKKSGPKPGTVIRQPGPTPWTCNMIAKAAQLVAAGKALSEVAEKLGVKGERVCNLKSRYSELWDAALDKARETFVGVVRKAAGTDAILKDPDGFMAMAEHADKWCRDHGQELFHHAGKLTLSTFYRDYYLPNCMIPDASESYRKFYEIVVRRWRLTTGDPPLEKIDNTLLARFRDCLAACRGRGGQPLSAATVANYLGMVQRLLDKAGPSDNRNRNAANLIPRVPWVKRPSVPPVMIKIVSHEQFSLVYRAAKRMIVPIIAGVKAADWWRCLLVVAFNTGLRRRALFGLRWEHLDTERRMFLIPAALLKTKRPHYSPLNQLCLDHLERMRTGRERIFEWPYHRNYLDVVFHRLQHDASLPRGSHFGLQRTRETTATRLWQFAPEAARLALGHATDNTTIRHYIEAERVVGPAIDALPQPEAFAANGG